MSIFAVEYTYNDLPDLRAQELVRHRAYLGSLAEDGRLLGSGPFTDGSPGALLVFRVEGRAALDALLAADPFQVVGLIAATQVRAWDLNLGGWAQGGVTPPDDRVSGTSVQREPGSVIGSRRSSTAAPSTDRTM